MEENLFKVKFFNQQNYDGNIFLHDVENKEKYLELIDLFSHLHNYNKIF